MTSITCCRIRELGNTILKAEVGGLKAVEITIIFIPRQAGLREKYVIGFICGRVWNYCQSKGDTVIGLSRACHDLSQINSCSDGSLGVPLEHFYLSDCDQILCAGRPSIRKLQKKIFGSKIFFFVVENRNFRFGIQTDFLIALCPIFNGFGVR